MDDLFFDHPQHQLRKKDFLQIRFLEKENLKKELFVMSIQTELKGKLVLNEQKHCFVYENVFASGKKVFFRFVSLLLNFL